MFDWIDKLFGKDQSTQNNNGTMGPPEYNYDTEPGVGNPDSEPDSDNGFDWNQFADSAFSNADSILRVFYNDKYQSSNPDLPNYKPPEENTNQASIGSIIGWLMVAGVVITLIVMYIKNKKK